MSLFSFNKHVQIDSDVLIVDIGNGSIGVASVSFSESKNPVIKHSLREQFPMIDNPTIESLKEVMKRTLEDAIQKISFALSRNEKKALPDQILCYLSSPWAFSEARTVEHERELDIVVTKDVIDTIKEAVINDIYADLNEDIEGQGKVDVILKDFSYATLNGYRTFNPLGKQARHIELSGFVSLAPRSIQDAISTIIYRSFPHSKIIFLPALYSYYRGVEQVVMVPPDYILYDMRSEVTDVCVVRNERLSYTASFPFGVQSALRTLGAHWNTSIDDAASRIQMLYDKRLSIESERATRSALAGLQDEWDMYLRELAQAISEQGALPATVIYSTEPGYDAFAQDMVLGSFGKYTNSSDRSGWFHILDVPLQEVVQWSGQVTIDHRLVLNALHAFESYKKEL